MTLKLNILFDCFDCLPGCKHTHHSCISLHIFIEHVQRTCLQTCTRTNGCSVYQHWSDRLRLQFRCKWSCNLLILFQQKKRSARFGNRKIICQHTVGLRVSLSLSFSDRLLREINRLKIKMMINRQHRLLIRMIIRTIIRNDHRLISALKGLSNRFKRFGKGLC